MPSRLASLLTVTAAPVIPLCAAGLALTLASAAQAAPAATREWGTYYGGFGREEGGSVAIDEFGGIILGGFTDSTTAIATPGSHQSAFAGNRDGFLTKFDAAGVRAWGTYYGGPEYEVLSDLAVDGFGNIYIAGSSNSFVGVATPGSHQPIHAGTPGVGAYDGFLAKLTSDGQLLWATYFGGDDEDGIGEIAVHADGTIYVVGSTSSTSGIATPGAYKEQLGGNGDGFVARFDEDGVLLWSTLYGGEFLDALGAVAADAEGNVYVAGSSNSTMGVATPGAHQEVMAGAKDAFLAKFDGDGNPLWATYYGGKGYDYNHKVVIDGAGAIYLVGSAWNSPGLGTPGTAHEQPVSAQDMYVARFDGEGTRVWGTYLGGELDENAFGVVADPQGGLYVCAGTMSSTGIATADAYQEVFGGGWSDGFLVKLDSNAQIRWGTYLGGDTSDSLRDCSVDTSGQIYVAINTLSDSGVATIGAHQEEFAGGVIDLGLAKFIQTPCEDDADCLGESCVEGVCVPGETTDATGDADTTGPDATSSTSGLTTSTSGDTSGLPMSTSGEPTSSGGLVPTTSAGAPTGSSGDLSESSSGSGGSATAADSGDGAADGGCACDAHATQTPGWLFGAVLGLAWRRRRPGLPVDDPTNHRTRSLR